MKRIKDQPSALLEKEPAIPVNKESFFHYLFKTKANFRLLLLALAINIICFIIYKLLFPFPAFYSDSHGYIYAAANNAKVYYRPWGYAYFLKLIHSFSDSHTWFVATQFLLLFLASIFCFFSTDFLFRFKNSKIKYISWALISFNPILLVLANHVGSDALFTSLSIIWFISLLWIIKKQSWWALLAQVILLYLCFSTRYNALCYPIITVLAFFLVSKASLHYKIVGSLTSVLIIFATYQSIKKDTERVTHAEVFAGFSGWQMANNALFLYKHIDTSELKFEDPELKMLNKVVQMYIDSLPQKDLSDINRGKMTSSIFMWNKNSPLKRYTFYYCRAYKISYFVAWYQVSILFSSYAKQIILQNPYKYLRYYILNNAGYFIIPDPEVLQKYNKDVTELPAVTCKWFKLKSTDITAKAPEIQSFITIIYNYLHAFVVIFSLIVPALYLYRQKKIAGKWQKTFIAPALLWYLFFLGNAAFSIFASIITLRYEVSWFVLVLCLPLWFLDRLKVSN